MIGDKRRSLPRVMYPTNPVYGQAFAAVGALVGKRRDVTDQATTTKDLVRNFVDEYFARVKAWTWNKREFDSLIHELDDALGRLGVATVTWSLLTNCRFAKGIRSLRVDDSTTIEPFRAQQLSEIWEAWGDRSLDAFDVGSAGALIVVRGPAGDHFTDAGPLMTKAAHLEACLRLAAPRSIGFDVTWSREDPSAPPLLKGLGSGSSLHQRNNLPIEIEGEYVLGRRVERALPTLLSRYATAKGDPAFDLAHERFNSAYRRVHLPDRIIDYWVAFEALFLPETDLELAYRASMRIARFLGNSPTEREELVDTLKRSYRLRSLVAHGVGMNEKKVQKLDPLELTTRTHNLLRRALVRWLDPAVPHDATSLDRALLG